MNDQVKGKRSKKKHGQNKGGGGGVGGGGGQQPMQQTVCNNSTLDAGNTNKPQTKPCKGPSSEGSNAQMLTKPQQTLCESKQCGEISKSNNVKVSLSSQTSTTTVQVKATAPVSEGKEKLAVIHNNEGSHNLVDKSSEQQSKAKLKSTNSFGPSSAPHAKPTNSPDVGAPVKSKAELRAERRAIQEAQRAAKQGKKDDVKSTKSTITSSMPTPAVANKSIPRIQSKPSSNEPETAAAAKAFTANKVSKSPSLKQVKLFSHLSPYKRNISVIQAAKDGIHPAIVRLGLQYADGVVCGSNARCTALIYALLDVVKDFKTPESKDFSHALTSMQIEPSMKFLEKCRPVSVGMQVVCKKIMENINGLPKDLTEDEAKKQSKQIINGILEDDIFKAHDAIITLAKNKIAADDVILTYGCSYLVKEVLTAAHQNVKFHVIVVDSRPKLEGKSMLRYLVKQNIECTYVLINAVAHVMQKPIRVLKEDVFAWIDVTSTTLEVTKVFLGAHALLANGYVMSRVGSSQVALVAKAFNKPVLVCCETYKFSELVQTDSFVVNELGNPDDLVETRREVNPLTDWQMLKSLNILNLYYDVTPPDLVTVIINDVHLVPCTSVPVLLRVKPTKK